MAGITFFSVIVAAAVAGSSALPTSDPVISKLDPVNRYQYIEDGEGNSHLADMWMKASDVQEAARFQPDDHIVYHLFTRKNPVVSQPMLMGHDGLIGQINYDPSRRTIMISHGWRSTVTSDINNVLVPAFLEAEDCNVIVIDWSVGGDILNYATAVSNTIKSGLSIARFINWLNDVTGASPSQYHLIGHSLGAHQVGIAGRNVRGKIAYITGLDPALPGWLTNDEKFRPNDGAYTEIIHTNAGTLGYLGNLGQVDFYPNGGRGMPGCNSQACDHSRSYFYLAESLLSGGFRGRKCLSYLTAISGNCIMLNYLRMGGLVPKTGSSGIYYMETNAVPPFSRR